MLVKPVELPGFWKFMYRTSPLTYLIHGMVSATLGDKSVLCSSSEMLIMQNPTSQKCGAYIADYAASTGGYVANPDARDTCEVCPIGSTAPLLESFDIDVNMRWRDLCIFYVYIVVNVIAKFAFFWMARKPKSVYKRRS